jgi:hypothetical protein
MCLYIVNFTNTIDSTVLFLRHLTNYIGYKDRIRPKHPQDETISCIEILAFSTNFNRWKQRQFSGLFINFLNINISLYNWFPTSHLMVGYICIAAIQQHRKRECDRAMSIVTSPTLDRTIKSRTKVKQKNYRLSTILRTETIPQVFKGKRFDICTLKYF